MSNKAKESTKQHLYDVFLCHNGCDKVMVEIIAQRLEDEANLRPFLDKWHLVLENLGKKILSKLLMQAHMCGVCRR